MLLTLIAIEFDNCHDGMRFYVCGLLFYSSNFIILRYCLLAITKMSKKISDHRFMRLSKSSRPVH